MGRMERVKGAMRLYGWHALFQPQGWRPALLQRPLMLKAIDKPFTVQTANGLLHGDVGDYLVRDPVTDFATVLPAGIAASLFFAAEGAQLHEVESEAAI